MSVCDKCGWNYVRGPVYHRGAANWDCRCDGSTAREHLAYECNRCGYAKALPCKGQKPPEEVP